MKKLKNRKDYEIELEDAMPLLNDLEIRRIKGSNHNENDDELKDDMPVPADLEIKEDN